MLPCQSVTTWCWPPRLHGVLHLLASSDFPMALAPPGGTFQSVHRSGQYPSPTPPPPHTHTPNPACPGFPTAPDLPKVGTRVVRPQGSYYSTVHPGPVLAGRHTPGGGSGRQGEVGPFDFPLTPKPRPGLWSTPQVSVLRLGDPPLRSPGPSRHRRSIASGKPPESPLPVRPRFCSLVAPWREAPGL